MPGYTKLQRVSRIKRRALPAVVAAFEAGEISAKRADLLLHLPADQQTAELEHRLSEAKAREVRNRMAANTIRQYLDSLHGEKVDLSYLSGIIRQALS
jgi:hypothetical protein